jgi:hypothetical protein
MKRPLTLILFLGTFLLVGCSTSARMASVELEWYQTQRGSEYHGAHDTLWRAEQLEREARLERARAARAKRTARRLKAESFRKMSAGTKARIAREERKARAALRRARELEREARRLRREVRG